MKRIEFPPAKAESIKIEFDCIWCDRSVKSVAMEVPHLHSRSAKDDYHYNFYYPTCESCSQVYYVTIGVTQQTGYVEIEELEETAGVAMIHTPS